MCVIGDKGVSGCVRVCVTGARLLLWYGCGDGGGGDGGGGDGGRGLFFS